MRIDEKTLRTIITLSTSHHQEFLVEADMAVNYPDIFIEYQKKRIVLMKELRNTMVAVGHP